MKPETLCKVMTIDGHVVTYSRLRNRIWFDRQFGGPSFRLRRWMHQLNQALLDAHCTTPDRVAMFLAQVGAESGSFRYTEELADGSEYNGRIDLGNTQPGDGPRFKGRTYLQVTGRFNYGALSRWAYDNGFVPTSTYFIDNPEKLADVAYIFRGPVWYWIVARHMNPYADRGDILGATEAVNGGTNNLSGRTERWNYARQFGNQLLPSGMRKHKKKPVPVPPPVHKHHHPRPRPDQFVTVQPNETLSSIAQAHGTTWQELQKLNHIADPNHIEVGQRLRLP